MPDFYCLTTDNNTIGIDRRCNTPLGERNRFRSSADELVQDFTRLRKYKIILFVEREDPRLEPLQARRNVDDLVAEPLYCLLVEFDTCPSCTPEARQQLCRFFCRIARWRPDDGEIEIIAKQILTHHALAIFFVELG
ncbi:hypothetical protein D3C80_982760 [compost metagenome]